MVVHPERIALRRGGSQERYQLASGQGARLSDESACQGEDLVLALSLDGGRKGARCEAWIRRAIMTGAAADVPP